MEHPVGEHRENRATVSGWAKKNLAPFWGLWLVALATLIAFAAVVIYYAR